MASKSKSVAESQIYDVDSSSTGAFDMPAGTTAQRPGSPNSGQTRFNSETGSLEFYDGTTWVITNLIPNVDSVTGIIVDGISTSLTLALTNATDTITVIFKEGGATLDTVSNISVSSGSATVSTTANVHGSSGSQVGDTISISVQNVDGTPSGNAVTKVVLDAPSGGATSDSGGYRTHTFTSTTNFTVASGTSITGAEMFIVAGGGSGGCHSGGGAGAGGLLWYSGTTVDGKSPNASGVTIGAGTHVCTVGAGAARGPTGGEYTSYTGWRTDLPSGTPNNTGNTGAGAGRDGGNSSIAISGGSTYTAIGGGGAGYYGCNGYDGGSGGAGGRAALGGSGTSGQGNNGGRGHASGSTGQPYPAGGGGGAKQGGAAGTNSEGGDGGAGYNFSSIFGTSVGDSGNFAGGGGGNMQDSPANPGEGGTGGGGGGGAGSGSAGASGAANTGGGGGGNQYNAARANHSQGGSGFIAIRYQLSNVGAP